MNGRSSSSRTRFLVITALVAGFQFVGLMAEADQASDALKWTPHRASSPRVDRDADALVSPVEAARESSGARAITSAPASVSLPDHVPAVDSAPAVRRSMPAVAASRPAPTRSPAPTGGMASRIYDPAKPDDLLGVRVIRTPPSPLSQPSRMATAAQGRPRSSEDVRLGGGLAPRYPQTRAAGGQRPERLAMNVDGIPSVMKQPSTGGPDAAGAPPPGLAPPRGESSNRLPTPAGDIQGEPMEMESIGPGLELPETGDSLEFMGDGSGHAGGCAPGECDGLLMGEYPSQLHVESFYDDPYACDPEENELSICTHDGRICRWLRQFGRPYYGWRWYRDFTASAGVTSFTNPTDLGINGNYGTNEALNWAMPFWNAFGVGWQLGVRGTQTNFTPTTVNLGGTTISKNARDQQFLTTGLFTRAFEGRGMQGGVAYDYMHDSWFEDNDLAQLRYEMSYVWGYHEFGFWGASNVADEVGIFGHRTPTPGVASTQSLYTGFYRVQFGDANELKVWGGGTSEQDGIVGALVRAPLHRSLAVESTFTYVIPNRSNTISFGTAGDQVSFSPSAWNLAINLVWYPAARSRRGLASPYRPLFEVADNGSMIRSLEGLFGP